MDPVGDLEDDAVGDLVSDHQRARGRAGDRCHVRASCRTTSDGDGPSVRLEGGPHGAVGMVESGAGGARRDAERLGDLGRAVARRSGAARGSPVARAAAVGTRGRAGRGRPRERVLIGGRRSVDRQDLRLTMRRRSRAAWAMQVWTRSRCSQASKRSGSRSPRRSRQAMTSASCRASSARSTSRRIAVGDGEEPVAPAHGSGRRTPPDPRPGPAPRDRGPPVSLLEWRPSGTPSTPIGRREGRLVQS